MSEPRDPARLRALADSIAEFAVTARARWALVAGDELDKIASLLRALAEEQKRGQPKSGMRCVCGHVEGMHPFGLSENIVCSGKCMLCPCQEFLEEGGSHD